jgi:hypothetical protein
MQEVPISCGFLACPSGIFVSQWWGIFPLATPWKSAEKRLNFFASRAVFRGGKPDPVSALANSTPPAREQRAARNGGGTRPAA